MFRAGSIHMRRVLYCLALAAALVSYVFNVTYYSWILFIVVIITPFVSLAISLPVLNRGRVTPAGNSSEDGLAITLQANPGALNPMRFQMVFQNLFTGDIKKRKAAVTPGKILTVNFKNSHCGVIRCHTARPRMLDAMGLFWLPLRKQKGLEAIIRPTEYPFGGRLSDMIETTVPDISGEKQYLDIRDYRQGDPIRDIHWKLTARRGQPIVREYAFFGANNLCIAVPFEADADRLTMQLGRLIGLVRYLDSEDYTYHILWLGKDGRTRFECRPEGADIEQYIDDMLWDVLSRPANTGADSYVPGDVMEANAHVLEVTSQNVIHHEQGLRKESYA